MVESYTHKDIIVYGAKNMLNTLSAGANAYELNGSSVNRPVDIIKVGDSIIVADLIANRVLIYGSGLNNSPTVVLGQPDETTGGRNASLGNSCEANTLQYPSAVTSNGTNLVIGDLYNNRVLIFNKIPTKNFQKADVVIGQSDFISCSENRGGAVAGNTLYNPKSVRYIGDKLFIGDQKNHRVLVYNSIPTTNGASASFVLGQASLSDGTVNRGGTAAANSLNDPIDIYSDGSRLFVTERSNHRILVWNSIPSSDIAADLVIGQPNLTTAVAATTNSGLSSPEGVIVADSKVYVADGANNRVLIWNESALNDVDVDTSANAASGILGQTNFTTSAFGGISKNSLYRPDGMLHDISNNKFYICDYSSNRILEFSSPPAITALGDIDPINVYGQSDFTSQFSAVELSKVPTAIGDEGVSAPVDVVVYGDDILVADYNNNRIAIFDNTATENKSKIKVVIGQSLKTDSSANKGTSASSSSIKNPEALAVDSNGALYVSDTGNHRILVFNSIPTSDNASANFVIGQSDFTIVTSGTTQSKLKSPRGLWAHGNKLYVVDTGNNRILAFDLPISSDGINASLVLGQANYTSGSVNAGTTINANTLDKPYGISVIDDILFVSDTSNNRILGFDDVANLSNNQNADYVLGASDFTTDMIGATTSQNTFSNYTRAKKFIKIGDYLIVSDPYVYRALGFDMTALSNGMNASYVWGQKAFVNDDYEYTNARDKDNSFGTLIYAYGFFQDGDYIYFAETNGGRLIKTTKDHFMSKKY